MPLHHALLSQHQPGLGNTGLGVEAELHAIDRFATHAHFDDDDSLAWVGREEIAPGARYDGDIGFRFGLIEGKRFLLPDDVVCRDSWGDELAQEFDNGTVQGDRDIFSTNEPRMSSTFSGSAPAAIIKWYSATLTAWAWARIAGSPRTASMPRDTPRRAPEQAERWRGQRATTSGSRTGTACSARYCFTSPTV